MRIAIFGGGSIGQRHATNARALGHYVKVFDPVESLGAHPSDVVAWSVFQPIDAVLICTPAATHEAVAEQLLDRGYLGPLFVEKPIALRSAAPIFLEWPHPVTMVGYNLRHDTSVDHLRRCEPNAGLLTLECDSRTWPGAAYAGLLEECSHEIDLALHLGAPAEVATAVLSEHEADIRLGAWHIHLNDRADRYWRRWDAFGATQGSSHILTEPGALGDEMYVAELYEFLGNVRRHGQGKAIVGRGCSFAEGLRVIALCERAKELAA
jgi:predicted dehydrogenase